MAQPALAQVPDLAAWVGEDIPSADARASAVLSAASTLVRSYTGQTWTNEAGALLEVPDDVAMVTVQVAARVWVNPEGVQADSIDDGSRRFVASGETGAYLTLGERDILSKYRTAGPKGLWTLGTTRGDASDTDQMLAVEGSEPIPFLPDGA